MYFQIVLTLLLHLSLTGTMCGKIVKVSSIVHMIHVYDIMNHPHPLSHLSPFPFRNDFLTEKWSALESYYVLCNTKSVCGRHVDCILIRSYEIHSISSKPKTYGDWYVCQNCLFVCVFVCLVRILQTYYSTWQSILSSHWFLMKKYDIQRFQNHMRNKHKTVC